MKKIIFRLLFVALLFFISYWSYAHSGWLNLKADRQLIKLSLRQNFWASEERELLVELVKSPESARQGLSLRSSLTSFDGQVVDGLLFVFAKEQPLVFWMKDMLFDIDICFLRRGQFLSCARHAPAQKENEAPASFASPALANMVLETLPDFLTDDDLQLKLFFK